MRNQGWQGRSRRDGGRRGWRSVATRHWIGVGLGLGLLWGASVGKGMAWRVDDLDRGAVHGRVADGMGRGIVGARVTALGWADRGMIHRGRTDERGEYRVGNLSPGTYRLRAEAAGFQRVEVTPLVIVAGQTLRHEFILAPGLIEETLTVPAGGEKELVDTTRTVVGLTIPHLELMEIPIESRNPLDAVFFLPGVSPPGWSDRDLAEGDRLVSYRRTPEELGNFSLQGGVPYSNNLTIEGMDNNDDRGARERIVPVLSAVEEVQVITNQYSAEYGRASGGRVNIRLRSGSRRHRGEIFGLLREARLNANGFFRNADPRRATRLPFFQLTSGGTLGGPLPLPLSTRRASFFSGYEEEYLDDRAEIAALVPVVTHPTFPLPAPNGANLGALARTRTGGEVEVNGGVAVGLYDRAVRTPRRSRSWQGRLELPLREGQRVTLWATGAATTDQRGFPGGRRLLETMRELGRSSASWAATHEVLLSDRWFHQLRGQRSALRPHDAVPLDGGKQLPVVLIEIADPRDLIGDGSANPTSRRGSLLAGSSTSGGMRRQEERWQIQETISGAVGSHTLRAGADLHWIRFRYQDLGDATGTFWFDSPADFLANRPSRFLQRFGTTSHLSNRYLGLFWQDDWRLRPGWTLAAGVRWDGESVLGDRNNLGPRLALAWDPMGDGKSVLRAGGGIFYNRAMPRVFDDQRVTQQTHRLDTNLPAAEGILSQIVFPGIFVWGDPRLTGRTVPEAGFVRRIEAGLRIPESLQLSTGYERQIRRGTKLEVTAVLHRGTHLWRESNLNAPVLPAGYPGWSEYLLSRDFPNPIDPMTGERVLTRTGSAEFVRFTTSTTPSQTIREGGRTIAVYGLNSPSTSNATLALRAARAIVRPFRPNPQLTQVEELQSRGNSHYQGLSIHWRQRLPGSWGSLRFGYTLSRTIDDGVVNTSSPVRPGDFRGERSASLLDARHRAVLSGLVQLPRWSGGLTLAGILHASSGRPFNLGIQGNDRNLDDLNNDRPDWVGGQPSQILWRRPGSELSEEVSAKIALPRLGSTGALPRNAGLGPAGTTLNLRASRRFSLGKTRHVHVHAEAFNPLNQTIFSFGAEFVDYSPANRATFLMPRRTIRPRTLRLGARFGF
jgi:hypothetical protein